MSEPANQVGEGDVLTLVLPNGVTVRAVVAAVSGVCMVLMPLANRSPIERPVIVPPKGVLEQ